jgi:acetylornithine/N-succinyldiaminopimelate aminotransferase
LLRGLKLKIDPKPIQLKLLERKVLCGVAGDNVLRLAPPLVITEAEADEALGRLDAALAAVAAEGGTAA